MFTRVPAPVEKPVNEPSMRIPEQHQAVKIQPKLREAALARSLLSMAPVPPTRVETRVRSKTSTPLIWQVNRFLTTLDDIKMLRGDLPSTLRTFLRPGTLIPPPDGSVTSPLLINHFQNSVILPNLLKSVTLRTRSSSSTMNRRPVCACVCKCVRV